MPEESRDMVAGDPDASSGEGGGPAYEGSFLDEGDEVVMVGATSRDETCGSDTDYEDVAL
jgi:hypothetical protein